MVSTQITNRKSGIGFMAQEGTQLGLTKWGLLPMPHQQLCSATVTFNSWRFHPVTLKVHCSHAHNPGTPWRQFLPFSVFLCSSQMALWTDREFLDALGGSPSSALTSWRSGFGFSLWRGTWPLLGIKFLYFTIHGILCVFSPQQFTGLSWGNCQVWRFWKCLEGFYFTAERQFDGLVQKELRFTQLHCLFWLHFLSCQKQRQAVMLISFRHFAVLFFLNLNSPVAVQDPSVQLIKAHPFLGVLGRFGDMKSMKNLVICFTR